jgi:hypothetical protein
MGMRMEKMIVGIPSTEAAAGDIRTGSILAKFPPSDNQHSN